jgi:serine/threonine protein kinase
VELEEGTGWSRHKILSLPVGTVIKGRYHLERRVGKGSFGAVYAATDDTAATPEGMDVAIKVRWIL